MDLETTWMPPRIEASEFIADFSGGVSERDLCDKYALSQVELTRFVSALRDAGRLNHENIESRRRSLEGIGAPAPNSPAVAQDPERKGDVDLDTGLVLHCPSCGAPVRKNDDRCGYCESPLDFSLRGKTAHCLHCYQRTPADSRFCVVCGTPMQPSSSIGALIQDRLCPRCALPLRSAAIGAFHLMACDRCSGLFITHQTFDLMQEKSQRIMPSTTRSPDSPHSWEASFSYVKCPECGHWMNRKNFAGISGVIVDMCPSHGIWFDESEMERIMDFIARGGIEKARVKDMENRAREAAAVAAIRKDQARAHLPDFQFESASRADSSRLDLIGLIGELYRIFKK